MKYCEKQLKIMKNSLGKGSNDINCFDESVIYTFPINVYPKKFPSLTQLEAYEKMEIMVKQLHLLRAMPVCLFNSQSNL